MEFSTVMMSRSGCLERMLSVILSLILCFLSFWLSATHAKAVGVLAP